MTASFFVNTKINPYFAGCIGRSISVLNKMKLKILKKSVIILIILAPLVTDQGCKKQPKCGCGKDAIFVFSDENMNNVANVYYSETTKIASFYSDLHPGSTFYFCNPGKWIDTLKTFPKDNNDQLLPLLIYGIVYYECNYLMNAANYSYYVSPVYQVDVTAIKEDNYGKK